MKKRLEVMFVCLVGVASLATGAGAEAAIVTVGSTASPTTGGENSQPVMFVNARMGAAGGTATSPIDGTIIRWRLEGYEGPWRLRVLTPNGGSSYTGGEETGIETVPDKGPHTYPAALPIKAGQALGIESTGQAWLGAAVSIGALYTAFVPPLSSGVTDDGQTFENLTFTFSADVLPPPTVGALAPVSGPLGGGTTVALSGGNFIEVKGVSFGGIPAASFSVLDEGSITAVAPASATLGPVPVSVTTAAGVATAPQLFAYEGCTVPKLRGRKLKGAKKAVRGAGCLVGKVRRRDGVTAKTGKVVKQRPKPGQVLPPGTKVSVKLG